MAQRGSVKSGRKKATVAEKAGLRNRVIERRRMLGSDLTPHAGNWRTHSEAQRNALAGILEEIGQAGELLAYHSDRAGGALVLIDGHLRSEGWADQEWDVAITDLNDSEADKLLLAHDPLAAMAGQDAEKLSSLLETVQTDSEAVAKLFSDLAGLKDEAAAKQKDDDVELSPEYSVLVKCAGESDQKAVLEELDRHGLEVRALVAGFQKVEKKEVAQKPVVFDGVEIVRESNVVRTGRVLQLEGIFDVPPAKRYCERWQVNLKLDRPWNIGLIVGPSGSGKSTVVRELFPEQLAGAWQWPPDKAVVDGFPPDMSIVEITGILSSVGFSSPPSWIKPFGVLSNGEQFRANLARTLAEKPGLAVVDEFTSVVDRTVAKVGSAAVAKAIREAGRQFIAVSCHHDIEEWLQPDWKLEMPAAALTWRSLRRRPAISVSICRANPSAWETFRRHHYLSHNLHRAAVCFVASVDGRPAAFASAIHSPHAHGGYWREHRTVCLPDFQGVGLGNTLSEFLASLMICRGKAYRSTTSHPAMIRRRLRSPLWMCCRLPALASRQRTKRKPSKTVCLVGSNAIYRLTASFEYIGSADPENARAFGVAD